MSVVIVVAAFVALALVLRFVVLSPSRAHASGTVVSVISGQVLVQPAGAKSPRPVVDGESLKQGDRVITKDDGRAVITFFEGSTETLQPNTDVTLQSLASTGDGGLFADVKQAVGKTWNNVFRTSAGGSDFRVETPAASAAVRDTMFQVSVDEDGKTDVWTRQGNVAVSAQGVEQAVPAGTHDVVLPGETPSAPEHAPSLEGQIRIDFTSEGWLAVRSPDGFISGEAPGGLPVNQIPLAIISDPLTKPQSVTLPVLESGTYDLFFTAKAAVSYQVSIFGTSKSFPVCVDARNGTIGADETWLAKLGVSLDGGRLASCTLGDAARTDENPFARLVIPNGLELALGRGQPLLPGISVLSASTGPQTSPTPSSGVIGQPRTRRPPTSVVGRPTEEPPTAEASEGTPAPELGPPVPPELGPPAPPQFSPAAPPTSVGIIPTGGNNTPVPTATDTPRPAPTDTPTVTATNTPIPPTSTPTPTATNTLTPTPTNTPAPPPGTGPAIMAPYSSFFSLTDLGVVTGVPSALGPLVFRVGDPTTLLIGGNANDPSGAFYAVQVNRGPGGHITGFGSVAPFASAPFNGAGAAYGPGSALFYACALVNQVGEIPSAGATPGTCVGGRNVATQPSVYGLGFSGSALKLLSWPAGAWYTATVSSDGSGNIGGVTQMATITNGGRGFAYIPSGMPALPLNSVLLCEYSTQQVVIYQADGSGNPDPLTRTAFVVRVPAVQAIVVDPVTGDIIIATSGLFPDHVFEIRAQ